MARAGSRILAINGASSNIKFAVFEVDSASGRILSGAIERIELADAAFRVKQATPSVGFCHDVTAPNHTAAVGLFETSFDTRNLLKCDTRDVRAPKRWWCFAIR